jgi:hypothetical protein
MTWRRLFRLEPTGPQAGRVRASDDCCGDSADGADRARVRPDGDHRGEGPPGDRRRGGRRAALARVLEVLERR